MLVKLLQAYTVVGPVQLRYTGADATTGVRISISATFLVHKTPTLWGKWTGMWRLAPQTEQAAVDDFVPLIRSLCAEFSVPAPLMLMLLDESAS